MIKTYLARLLSTLSCAAVIAHAETARVTFFEAEALPRSSIARVEVLKLSFEENTRHETYIKSLTGPDLAKFLDVLDHAHNRRTFKVSTPVELEFVMTDGTKKRFRAGEGIVRPRLSGSDFGNTWHLDASWVGFF